MMRFSKHLRCLSLSCLLFFASSFLSNAQWCYGTTGLLNMPTADMNRSGTFMMGNNYLNKHVSTARWFYDTFGYYFNVTLFPFLEIGYNMELHKGMYDDYGSKQTGYWLERSYGRFCNQDRQFCVKLRVWKEGGGRDWMPQITIGSDDISTHSWGEVDKQFSLEDYAGNGFNNRYYVAASKHFAIKNVGVVGAHLSYLYNIRSDYYLNAPSFGANIDFSTAWQGNDVSFWQRLLRGFNVMMEMYPANGQGYVYEGSYYKQYGLDRGVHLGIYDINIGAEYKAVLIGKGNDTYAPKTEIAFFSELYGCTHFGAGIQLRLKL